jgi:hypothetical protein
VAELPRAFSGLDPIMVAGAERGSQPGNNGGERPRRMEIEGTQPGERFVFVFDR